MDDNTPKVGRPEIPWTKKEEDIFNGLMGIPFVTQEAICAVMGMSYSTLQRKLKENYGMNFDQLRQEKREGMKLKLAGKQYEVAMKGNVSMLIWLGKQWLDQKDKQETEINGQMISIIIDEDDSKL